MKKFVLVLALLAASCKTASSDSSTAASPTPGPIDDLGRTDHTGRTEQEILFNAIYTGYQPASSGDSLGEPCTVSFIFLSECEKTSLLCLNVTVEDQGQTPLIIETNRRDIYYGVKKDKAGEYSFYSSKFGLYEHTKIEWNEQPQVVKVTATRHLDIGLPDWRLGKGNGTIECQNLTKVKQF